MSALFELTAQTTSVGAPGKFSLSMKVASTLPPSSLAVAFELYTPLPSRTYYEASEANTELASEGCLDELGPFTLPGLSGVLSSGIITYHLRVSTGSGGPTCSTAGRTLELSCVPGSCAGVYPLKVVLIDTENGSTLRSFTTHLICTVGVVGSHPLQVALVLPVDAPLPLAPSGHSTLSSASIKALTSELEQLVHHGSAHLSLDIYPSTVLALQRSVTPKARIALQLLGKLLHTPGSVEVLRSPFVPLDVTSLVASGLGGDVAAQLNRGLAELANAFSGRVKPQAPYATTEPLSVEGLQELEASCVSEFVLPEASVPAFAGLRLTPTAPFELQPSGTCSSGRLDLPEGVDADTALAREFSVGSGGPILAAENLIGDLAQVYFEGPNAAAPREVVIAPSSVPDDDEFMTAVLSALRSVPILSTETLSSVFSSVVLGANDNVRAVTLAKAPPTPAFGQPISDARNVVSVVTSVDPANTTLDQRLHDSIFLAEATGTTTTARAPYLAAPSSELRAIASELQVSVRTYTLTARTGKIPITILFSPKLSPGPLHVIVRLASGGAIEFLSAARQPLLLNSGNNLLVAQVGTRTSGAFPLSVELVSASGAVELSHGTLLVRSTAVSGVAIALSVAALLVLLGWWLRSGFRRRGRHRRTAARAEELTGAEP